MYVYVHQGAAHMYVQAIIYVLYMYNVRRIHKVKWGNSGQSSQFLVQHRQNLIDVHQIASAITSVCAFCKYVKSLLERQLSPRQGNSRHAG